MKSHFRKDPWKRLRFLLLICMVFSYFFFTYSNLTYQSSLLPSLCIYLLSILPSWNNPTSIFVIIYCLIVICYTIIYWQLNTINNQTHCYFIVVFYLHLLLVKIRIAVFKVGLTILHCYGVVNRLNSTDMIVITLMGKLSIREFNQA